MQNENPRAAVSVVRETVADSVRLAGAARVSRGVQVVRF